MIIHDNVVECEACGHHEFKEEERMMFHKNIRARELDYEKEKPLIPLHKRIIYVCAECGTELPK